MIAAPKSINPAAADRFRRDLDKVLADPDILEKNKTFGYEPFPRDQMTSHIATESAKYADVIKKGNISLD